MNKDTQALLERLRTADFPVLSVAALKAADTIEALTRERDAARHHRDTHSKMSMAWADKCDKLEAERDAMAEALRECADDLEAEVKARWCNEPDGSCHPALQPKLDRDLGPVARARAALTANKQEGGQ